MEYTCIGINDNENIDGYTPNKISRNQPNKYNIGPQILRETATTEQPIMLNLDKTKKVMTKLLQNMTSLLRVILQEFLYINN